MAEPEPEPEEQAPQYLVATLPQIDAIFRVEGQEEDVVWTKRDLITKLEGEDELLQILTELGKDTGMIIATLRDEEHPLLIDTEITFDEFAHIVEDCDIPPPPPILDPPFDRSVFKDLRIRDFVAQTVTYNTNDTKEKICLESVQKWNRQFTQLYPERRPLLLCPFNECGIRKFICTTLRPTKLPYKQVYEYTGCVKFVFEYLVYEPLEEPLAAPTHAPSPHSVFTWQRGDSLDFAVALCSMLLGVGFDAHVVCGYAPNWVTKGDSSKLPVPSEEPIANVDEDLGDTLGLSPKPRGGKTDAADELARFSVNKYAVVEPAPLDSGYEAMQAAKAKAAAAAAAEEAARVPPTPEELDEYSGMRVHFWVLLRVGKRQVTQPLFCDAVTGRVYPVTNSPYLGVEAVFNDKNYFVNMQQDNLPTDKLSWKLQNPVLWEFVFYEEPTSSYDLGLDGSEADLLGMEADAPEATRLESDVGDGSEILEVPPSWSRRCDIPREKFENRALGKEKAMQYKHIAVEIFAEHHRPDGCVEIVQYAENPELPPKETVFNCMNRVDKLTKRTVNGETGQVHEQFDPGHREQTGQSTYSSAPTGRITGLKDIVTGDTKRELRFYPSARLDGLAKRTETFGVKVAEDFEGRDDHLIFHSIVFDIEGLTEEELHSPDNRAKGIMVQKIRKMTQKYERNPEVLAEEDISKKTYYYKEGKIRLDYHHAPSRISRRSRMFSKLEEKRVDALSDDPVKTVGYDDYVKAPKVLWEQEKLCLIALKDAELEAKSLLAAREKDEAQVAAVEELQAKLVEKIADREDLNPVDSFTAPQAAKLDQDIEELKAQLRQDSRLEEDIADRIRKKIAEGGADTEGDDKKDLIEERDYLKPYLPEEDEQGRKVEPHDMSVRLSKNEAIRVKDECLKSLKDSLIERANIIQSRLDDENAVLARRQAAFQRNREHQTQQAEEEYEDFCAEAWFRIQILEQRLSRHEDAALQKFAELDTTLRNDPRLSCLHEYS